MNKLILILLISLSCYSYATNKGNKTQNYDNLCCEKAFLFDQYNSMYSGSSLVLSTRSFLDDLEDYLIPKKLKSNFWVLLGTMALDLYINIVLDVFYYEIFGRSFRIRSLGGSVKSYELSFFNDIFSIVDINAIYPKFWPSNAHDIPLLISIARYEANQILLQELTFKSLRNRGKIGHGTIGLYGINYLNTLGVFLNSRKEIIDKETGDTMLDYIYYINTKHQQAKMRLSDLRWASLIFIPDFLVDLTIYCLLSKEERNNAEIRAFKWNNMAYKPFFTVKLTPFGIAYCMNNYIQHQEKIFLLSLDLGKSPFYTNYYGGIGSKTDGLYTYKNYTLDVAANIWYQPKLLLKASDVLEDKNYFGGLIGIMNKYKINSYLSLDGALSYKTLGFLEGIMAQNGFTFQAGFTLKFYTNNY